jgi:ubiquitin related modifier 1
MASKVTTFPVKVEFTYDQWFSYFDSLSKILMIFNSGGLELLFSNERKHTISVPESDSTGSRPNVSWLVDHLCTSLMKDPRKDMFVIDGTV